MSDYISRQAAIDALPKPKICEYMDEFGAGRNSCAYDAEKAIEDVSSADVVPVVHGRWLPQKENHEFKEAWMKCSVCGYPVSRWTGNTNFCPNCGAKMDGKGEE